MSKKKDCSCGEHKKGHHEDMSQSEKIQHLKDCLSDIIQRIECVKEMADKISLG